MIGIVLSIQLFYSAFTSANEVTKNYTLDQFDEAVDALPVAKTSRQDPVQVSAMLIPAQAEPGETVVVVQKIRIHPNWHIYAYVPKTQPFIVTQWKLDMGDDLFAVDRWSGFEPTPYKRVPGIEVYKSTSDMVFYRELMLSDDPEESDVEVNVGILYQACDPEICLPPVTKLKELSLAVKNQ